MKDNDFISQMLIDTLDDSSSELINDFMFSDSNETSFEINVDFDDVRKCYLFSVLDHEFEVPMNWGPFKNRIASEFTLSKSEDSDKFLDIISSICNDDITSIQIRFTHRLGEFFNGHGQAA